MVTCAHGVRATLGSSPSAPTFIFFMINYDDFKKLDLRVAKILAAERVKNSEKLIKLQIDLGEGKRQIVAGIGKFYSPEDLINKKIIIVANLEPKSLMGLESNGMLLAASNDDTISLLIPDQDLAPGAIVK